MKKIGQCLVKSNIREFLYDDGTILYPECVVVTQIKTCDKIL